MAYKPPGTYAQFVRSASAVVNAGNSRILALVGTGINYYTVSNEAITKSTTKPYDELKNSNVFEITKVSSKPIYNSLITSDNVIYKPKDVGQDGYSYSGNIISWDSLVDAEAKITKTTNSNFSSSSNVSFSVDETATYPVEDGKWMIEVSYVTEDDADNGADSKLGCYRVINAETGEIVGEYVVGTDAVTNDDGTYPIPGVKLVIKNTYIDEDALDIYSNDSLVNTGDYFVITTTAAKTEVEPTVELRVKSSDKVTDLVLNTPNAYIGSKLDNLAQLICLDWRDVFNASYYNVYASLSEFSKDSNGNYITTGAKAYTNLVDVGTFEKSENDIVTVDIKVEDVVTAVKDIEVESGKTLDTDSNYEYKQVPFIFSVKETFDITNKTKDGTETSAGAEGEVSKYEYTVENDEVKLSRIDISISDESQNKNTDGNYTLEYTTNYIFEDDTDKSEYTKFDGNSVAIPISSTTTVPTTITIRASRKVGTKLYDVSTRTYTVGNITSLTFEKDGNAINLTKVNDEENEDYTILNTKKITVGSDNKIKYQDAKVVKTTTTDATTYDTTNYGKYQTNTATERTAKIYILVESIVEKGSTNAKKTIVADTATCVVAIDGTDKSYKLDSDGTKHDHNTNTTTDNSEAENDDAGIDGDTSSTSGVASIDDGTVNNASDTTTDLSFATASESSLANAISNLEVVNQTNIYDEVAVYQVTYNKTNASGTVVKPSTLTIERYVSGELDSSYSVNVSVSDADYYEDIPGVNFELDEDAVVASVKDNTSVYIITTPSIKSDNIPGEGDTYYVSYKYRKSDADYEPQYFTDYDDIVATYGNYDVSASSAVLNSLSLGAEIAFNNGVSNIVCVQARNNTDYEMEAAIDKLTKSIAGVNNVSTVVPLTTSNTVGSYLKTHVDLMSSYEYGKERMGYLAASINQPINKIASKSDRSLGMTSVAAGYNDERIVYVVPGAIKRQIRDLRTGKYNERTLAGCYAAVAVASVGLANDPAEPLTNKTIAGFTELVDLYSESEKNQLASVGCCVLEHNGSNIRIRHGITTNDDEVNSQEITLIQIKDYVIDAARSSTSDLYIGRKLTASLVADIKYTMESLLNKIVSQGIIISYSSLKVKRNSEDPRQVDVSFEIEAVYPLNWISIEFGFSDVSF